MPCLPTGRTLTERIDTPDDALREDLVLVQRDERAERRGREEREDDRIARPVTLEDLGLDERVGRALDSVR